MVNGAWVTLATNDSYSLGALVLAHSLKQVGTQQELAILVTPGVTNSMRARLSDVFNIVREVNVLDSRDKANLRLLQRPELGITFTKLHCWQLTEYEKCVFLDADTLVLQNCDELFEREELSAAPDVGWPDCFNSGVFVYRPSEETYNSLIQFALDKGSFDGGDQGLLNLYFADWARKDISKHLPFIYNVCSTAFYSYLPAFKQFGKDVKIIHFIGNAKPWLQYFDTESKKVRPSRDLGHLEPILQRWWNIFCSMIHPNLSPDMSGLAGAFAKLTLGQQRTPEQEALEDSLRRQNWEQGNIDYLGKDSFDNIWSKICDTLAKGPQEDGGVKDLELASPQQETCVPLREDVPPASQETPLTTEPNSSSPPLALSSESTPIDSVTSPKIEPTSQETLSSESVPSVTPKTEETSVYENVSIATEQSASGKSSPPKEITESGITSVDEVPPEILPTATEIPKAPTLLCEQIQSEILPPTKKDTHTEIVPASTEKTTSEGTTTVENIPLPTTQATISSSPAADISAPPQEVQQQDILPAMVSAAPSSDPTPLQSLSEEQGVTTTQPVSKEELACPLKAAPQVEGGSPTSEVSPSIPASQEIPAVQKVETIEQCPISEKSSCGKVETPKGSSESEKAAAPSSAQSAEQISPEKISQLSSQDGVSSPNIASVEELPSNPELAPLSISSAPTDVLPSPIQTTPPKPEEKSLKGISQVSEEKVPSSPTQTATLKEVPSKPSPPKDVLPSLSQTAPVKEGSCKPSPPKEVLPSPTQTTSEQVPSKEESKPSEEKLPPSPTQAIPQKVASSAPEGSPAPPSQVPTLAPADTTIAEPSNVSAPVVSPETPPPIAPPPRKSGGNKKQGKSKK